jgi:hypothetical protein
MLKLLESWPRGSSSRQSAGQLKRRSTGQRAITRRGGQTWARCVGGSGHAEMRYYALLWPRILRHNWVGSSDRPGTTRSPLSAMASWSRKHVLLGPAWTLTDNLIAYGSRLSSRSERSRPAPPHGPLSSPERARPAVSGGRWEASDGYGDGRAGGAGMFGPRGKLHGSCVADGLGGRMDWGQRCAKSKGAIGVVRRPEEVFFSMR